MKTSNIIYGILLAIILVLSYILIFRKPGTVIEPFDDTELRQEIVKKDSMINYWERQALGWKITAFDYIQKSDSLEGVKTNIKSDYEHSYKAIPDGTNVVLDSIIRANW